MKTLIIALSLAFCTVTSAAPKKAEKPAEKKAEKKPAEKKAEKKPDSPDYKSDPILGTF